MLAEPNLNKKQLNIIKEEIKDQQLDYGLRYASWSGKIDDKFYAYTTPISSYTFSTHKSNLISKIKKLHS